MPIKSTTTAGIIPAFRTAACAVALLVTSGAAHAEGLSFPADYKQSFTNYLSLDRTQNADQIIRLFANDKTIAAAKAGQEIPDGAIIVGEIYKAKLGADGKPIVSALGRKVRDKLAVIAVMQKKAGSGKDLPPELQNDGWEFAAFKPDGTDAGKNLNECRACHAPLKDTQHLFSIEHLK